MCGIAGTITGTSQAVSKERLKKMTDAIAHRGPDGEAQWVNTASMAALGHRRLSIIDLSDNAAQPMHYMNRYSIVHNGEVYNYIELRQELESKGYHFRSQSDTEVMLAAYDCWKENCLQHFDGMFAFAIWDEAAQTLFAARDRFGEKPFYYCFDGDTLLFASEMKALWAAGVPKKVNEALLFNFITLGYTQNPGNPAETAYQHIYKLPAASFFIVHPRSGLQVNPVVYWQADADYTAAISAQDAIEKFRELFTQSVACRLRADVPLGTSLSGGIDSSSIAAMIQQLQPANRLQTFSAVFPGTAGDETRYIQLLTEEKAIDNYTVCPTAEDFIATFDKLCYHQEGFIGSASVYAQYKVFELARQHGVKVMLDGQGADETLAGYHKYYHWFWQELYKTNKRHLQNEINAAKQLGITAPWNWKNKLAVLHPLAATAYAIKRRSGKQLAMGGFSSSFLENHGISYYQLPQPGKLNNVLHYNTFSNGLEELLGYADRNSMAHAREVRLPFLQHRLVEFIFSLPAQLKIKDGRSKWVLRKAMESSLPSAIAWRKDKIGFEPPQRLWMQQPAVQERMVAAREKLVAAGILGKQVLNKKIQPQDTHAADNFDWRYLSASMLL